jgi:ABC-type branched-subunit amino acid transport system substrate-binding protein
VKRIALVHATALAIAPVHHSFQTLWPDAVLHDILDDGLPAALEAAPATLAPRFEALARDAQRAGADAVLFTCSAFGAAIDAARRAVALPMLKPNDAMFDDALDAGRRIALVATFAPSLPSMAQEFSAACHAAGRQAELTTVHVPGAFEALQAGQAQEHDRLIAQAIAELPFHDAVMLAQVSMASAAVTAASSTSAPVLTSPDSAVRRLRRMLGGFVPMCSHGPSTMMTASTAESRSRE